MGSNSYDIVSSSSHFATAVWAAFATLVLLRLTKGHGVGRWAIGAFGLSMVLLYSASALFHGWRYATFEERLLFQKIDKSAVFLMIAGSYVPVVVYLLQGRWRRWTLAAVAGTTAFGIGVLWLAPALPYKVLIGVYVLLGLSGLAPIRQYAAVAGWHNARWAVGIISPYLGGATVEVLQTPVLIPGWFGPHELMHFADTLGTLVYFAFLLKVLIRRPPLCENPTAEPEPAWEPAAPDLTRSGFVPAGT
ncbi:MAG TPA: hemolysin III family protein [Fimbriiglobus sp.]|nr:hemolysin III family protein [Fimbriiglobus sp.]